MSYLRSNRAQLVAIVVLAGLLLTAAVFQYDWLGQLSERERERMQQSLEAASRNMRFDFDSGLAEIYKNFQVDFREEESFPQQLAARYTDWVNAVEVSLIDRIFWITNDEDTGLTIEEFHGTEHLVTLDEWPAEIAHLKADFNDALRHSSAQRTLLVGPPPLQDDVPAVIVQQLLAREFNTLDSRDAISWVVVFLNRDRMFEQVIPELADQYISADARIDYNVAIRDDEADGALVYVSNPDLTAEAFADPDAEGGIYGLRWWNFDQRNGLNRLAWRVLEESNQPRWTLVVKHRAGSLEAAVATARNRSLAISLGILALLGGSIAMIVVSTRRAQLLAEQQMEFVAGVSHELRTPLAVIRAAGENLADDVVLDPDKTRQYGELIDREGRRLSDMVERVLLFAKMRSGQEHFELAPVDVNTVISDAIQANRSLLAEQSVVIENNVPDSLPFTMADSAALKSALGNLLQNAIKYSPPGSVVTLDARHSDTPAGNEIQIAVRDQGAGIPAAELPLLFEPFFRGKGAQRAQIQGSGLGLNLVKRVVEAHGGRITVESVAGEGSTFVIFLPAAELV